MFHDGVEDDARFALAVARTARARGAVVATRRSRPTALLARGRIAGRPRPRRARAADFVIRARAVIDATGVWSAVPARPFGGGSTPDPAEPGHATSSSAATGSRRPG